MAGVQRLDDSEHLGATKLTDDHPVGPQSQCGSDQLDQFDGSYAVCRSISGFESNGMPTFEYQFGRVFDHNNPIGRIGETHQTGEQRCLP